MPKNMPKRSEVKQSEALGSEADLPWQAYAIVPARDDPATWQLPHHTRQINRAIKGKIGLVHTVDWELVMAAVRAISRQGVDGQRIRAPEQVILAAAAHLAAHYRKAGLPLPDALAVLV